MIDFTEDQEDALKEIANLAMGEAGVNLNKALSRYIKLSIPESKIIEIKDVITYLITMNHEAGENVSIVRLGFQGFLDGEVLLVFGEKAFLIAGELLDEESVDSENEGMLLREISNILAIACLNGMANRLGGKIMVSPATVFSQRAPFKDSISAMFSTSDLLWNHTIITKISFKVEDKDFHCNLFIFLSEKSISKLVKTLNDLLSDL